MKSKTFIASAVTLVLLFAACSGCTRAVRDGVSIGVTDGLSGAIAQLVDGFFTSFTPTVG